MHYPAPVTIASSSSLCFDPNCQQIDHHAAISRNSSHATKGADEQTYVEQTGKKISEDRSLIDISNLDYGAYRHKIIEATLKKHYDDIQPPGDVVLNSLHLNSTDSVIGVRLNEHYNHSLFDFIEEYYDASGMKRGGLKHRLHPLDHFLTKGEKRPRTTEKETETLLDDDASSECVLDHEELRSQAAESNDNLAKLSSHTDKNGNLPPCRSLSRGGSINDVGATRNDRNSNPASVPRACAIPISQSRKFDKMRVEYRAENHSRSGDFRATRTPPSRDAEATEHRPASADNPATKGLPKGLALSRAATLPERKGRWLTRSSRPGTAESKKKLADYPDSWESTSSREQFDRRDDAARDGPGFTSLSSSEIASACNEFSGSRSRESSTSPWRPPWLSANYETSFNRKYANKTARTARDDRPRKLPIPTRKRSKDPSSIFVNYGDPSSSKRRAASLASSRKTDRREAEPPRARRRDRSGVRNIERDARMRNDEDSGSATVPPDASEEEAIIACKPAVSTVSTERAKPTYGSGARRNTISKEATVNRSADLAVRADDRQNTAKLNRGSGRQRALRSAAENPRVSAKGSASLSPKIELSAEALSRADDIARSSRLPCDERLTTRTSGIDASWTAKSTAAATEAAENDDEARAVLNAARDRLPKTKEVESRYDVKSNNVNGGSLGRSKVPQKITVRNPRARPASAGNLAENSRDRPAPRRHASAETKTNASTSGGVRLNARSNDAMDPRIKRRDNDEEGSSSVAAREPSAPQKTKSASSANKRNVDIEQLRLPRRDSRIGLVMNSALRRYIKMLKHGLLNHGDKDGITLASLSLTDAISVLSEQKMPLSSEEVQELQNILSRVERNPELLYKESSSSVGNAV